MGESIGIEREKKPRLKFIDIARSIAILLMLEGHFIDQTLGLNFRSPDAHFVNPDFFWYDCWHIVRGYTSPMFLTMTGLIFTFLLYTKQSAPYFKNDRVKKGFRRVAELLFWGYVLNPKGFHILQCIAIGMFGLLVVYGIYRLIRVIPLWLFYFAISMLIFSFWAPLNELQVDGTRIAWPVGWPKILQNMISAPSYRSVFPLAPHLGYTFFGAGIGVLLHAQWMSKFKWNISIFLISLGLIFTFYSTELLYGLFHFMNTYFGFSIENLAKGNWLFENLGVVLIVLGLLSTLEKIITIRDNLFLKIGRNTLPIFVIHMIILYGAIIHVGISTFFSWKHNPLNPYEAAVGAALFLTLFVVLVYYLEPLTKFYKKIVHILFPFLDKSNKIA